MPQKPNYRKKQLSWRRSLRYLYHRFARMQGSPKTIARGIAAGVFAGWFPWFGFQMIIAIGLATAIRGNKIAAAAATWVSNPFTYVPIFAFNYQIGNWLLKNQSQPVTITGVESWQEIMHLGADFLVTLFVGCFVVGIICSIVSYFLGLKLTQRLQAHRHRKRSLARHKRMKPTN